MRGQAPPRNSTRARGRIALLSDSLVDQIAAGEVVERPASVVKELVENALDAGASRVRVDVRQGGAALIAVSDDGCGMSAQDAALALRRHATSKLHEPDDLTRILSFGFRGEALPAIASVSRLRLRTRARNAPEAWEIRVEAGRILSQRATAGPAGTRVEVADLFATVPARRKFLKKPATEWAHVADWLGRLALATPEIHFEVRRDDREARVWPATSSTHDRIAAVLSEQLAEALVPIEWEEQIGHIHAFVSSPEYSRADTQGLYLYVNGRPVRDRLLRGALLASYRDWLPRGRHPAAVLFLSVAPEQVDVNVHPAKWEVRFSDPQAIRALLRHAVREAMASRSWLSGSGTTKPGVAQPDPANREHIAAGDSNRRQPLLHGGSDATHVAEQPAGDWLLAEPGMAAATPIGETRVRFAPLRRIGQLLASYLLFEADDALLIVDQHAAHERILYERLRAGWLARGVERQGLLAAEAVEVGPLGFAALAEHAEIVKGMGFDLEPFGEEAVAVRAIPALLAGTDPQALIRELSQTLGERGRVQGDDRDRSRLLSAADRSLATLACHAARRFGDRLEDLEQRAIARALDEIPWAATCPHGRPVAFVLGREEIERRFGRR